MYVWYVYDMCVYVCVWCVYVEREAMVEMCVCVCRETEVWV